MRKTLTHLNPKDMALILMLFEGATLLVLSIAQKYIECPAALGAVVGFAGGAIALGIWHRLGFAVKGHFQKKHFVITGFDEFRASAANGAFLGLLFWAQQYLGILFALPMFGIAIFGFIGVAIAFAILFLVYNIQPIKIQLTINSNFAEIKRIALRAAILAGLYEAFILPIMFPLQNLPLNDIISYPIAGIVSGLIGGFIGTVVYNYLAPLIKPWIDI